MRLAVAWSRVPRAQDSEHVHTCCSTSIACTCAFEGFETPIHSCAYLRWGLRHGHSDSCRGLPSVLLVHVRLRGLKHPYIHTTLAPLGACRHEGGLGGPERPAPASVSKHLNAASTGKRSKHRSAERSLRSKCSVPFPSPRHGSAPSSSSQEPVVSQPAGRHESKGLELLELRFWVPKPKPESQRRSCAQPRVSHPPNFRIQSLASCHCHYLFLGGLLDQGIGVFEWPNYCTSPHDFVMTAAFIFFFD